MKNINKLIAIHVLVSSILLSSCGAGQLFGPTITPSPTTTSTRSPTPTATATLTFTATYTPEPTRTKTPFPACKLEILNSKDLKDFDLFVIDGIPAKGQKHSIVQDNGISVSKLVYTKGEVYLAKALMISKVGNYLISVDVKRGDIKKFHLRVVSTGYDTSFVNWSKDVSSISLSYFEFTKVTGLFEVKKKPTQPLLILLRASPNDGTTTTTIWLKNLQLCLID